MNGTLLDRLSTRRRVHIDTNVVVYFLQSNPVYLSLVRPLFQLVDSGRIQGLSSYVTLLEVLVQPLKEGRPELAEQYREILLRARNLRLFPVDRAVAEAGAAIRAAHGFRTPDAIQLATAMTRGADALVTNDSSLRRFREVDVLVLDDFRATAGG